MHEKILILSQSLLLVVALSLDAFVASFAYGINRIKIPRTSVLAINFICSAILAVSLLAGTLLRNVIPPHMTQIICFLILLFFGVVKLCDSAIKSIIRKNNGVDRRFSFSVSGLRFLLRVYADPEKADSDASKSLSLTEAISLAAALSLDGLAVGFGAALTQLPFWQVVLFSFGFGILAVAGGCVLGNRVSRKIPLDLSWLSGALLIVLAF